jgi:hypothetical protein
VSMTWRVTAVHALPQPAQPSKRLDTGSRVSENNVSKVEQSGRGDMHAHDDGVATTKRVRAFTWVSTLKASQA